MDSEYSFELDDLNIYDLNEITVFSSGKDILESKKNKDSKRNKKYYQENRAKIIEKRKQRINFKKPKVHKYMRLKKPTQLKKQIFLDKKTNQIVISL